MLSFTIMSIKIKMFNCVIHLELYVPAEGAVRPVISLQPNWSPVLYGDTVTLSCNVAPTAQGNLGYSWYRDGYQISGDQQSLVIQSARETDSGDYQCQAGASERSDEFKMDIRTGELLIVSQKSLIAFYPSTLCYTVSFISGWLVLQAPPAVHEGDSLSLRCHSDNDGRNITFYKDNKAIQLAVTGSALQIGIVNVKASGIYRCEKQIYSHYGYRMVTATETVAVSELFSMPQLLVTSHSITEGDHMTITCDTKLSPHRETTELQFAFYRNGHNVQGFSLSNQYGVPSAQLEDSGNYTCEVQTPTGSVRKRSREAHIHIQGEYN
uniref:Ig-like domain-containing protein n=1 Tax=Xenopus tropicalis TaxID=8364 RepID=A0A803JGI3_XENTR